MQTDRQRVVSSFYSRIVGQKNQYFHSMFILGLNMTQISHMKCVWPLPDFVCRTLGRPLWLKLLALQDAVTVISQVIELPLKSCTHSQKCELL